MKSRSMDLTKGPVVSGIIRYTIPIVLSSALQLLFNAADLMVVGQFCGSLSVGAISSTGAMTNLIINLFVGLSVGAGVCVAHAMGSHKEEELHHTIHTAIPLSLLCGVILTAAGILLTRPLLELMGTPEDVLPLSETYMIIYFGGVTFTLLYNFGSAILRAAGDTKSSLIYLSLAGVLNIILNLVFVICFQMNVAGVGLATVISQAVSALLVLWELMRRPDACRYIPRESHIYAAPLRKMTTIGLPAGIQGCLFSISNVVIQSSVNSFGTVMVAGCGAASNIEGFIWTTMSGVGQAAVNYTGQNLGAHKFDRIHKVYHSCLCIVFLLGLVMGVSAYIYAPQLLSIYITDSPAAIAAGQIRMLWICLPYCFGGIMDTLTGCLRGLGKSLLPMLVTILGVCVLRVVWVSTIFQIPKFHTPSVLFASYIVSWIVTEIVQFILFKTALKKLEQQAELPVI